VKVLELLLLFGIMPLFLLLGVFPKPWILYLFIAGVGIVVWLRRWRGYAWRQLWNTLQKEQDRAGIVHVVSRFGMNSIGVVLFMFFLFPEKLLLFPADEPLRWIAVLLGYPLIMVYPQELFFRLFFVERYGTALGSKKWVVLINGFLFGWVHILYGNWIAVALSTVGGFLFMDTFLRTRSMKLVWLEHALYGNLIFTVGLGEYFYSGWAG
jgi:membrane protease YdiL (CAAX protease family)